MTQTTDSSSNQAPGNNKPHLSSAIPPVLSRVSIDLSTLDLASAYRSPILQWIPDPHISKEPHGVWHLTIARPADTPDQRVVFFLDSITHANRHNAQDFLLDRVFFEGEPWHVGCFKLPDRLHTGVGFMLLSEWNPEVGSERSLWCEALERCVPLLPKGNADSLSELFLTPPVQNYSDSDFTPSPKNYCPRVNAEFTPQSFNSEEYHTSLWYSSQLEVEVCTQLRWPHSSPRILLIMTDGDQYTRHTPLLPALRAAEIAGKIPPIAVLFFSTRERKDRNSVLGSGELFDVFLTEELLPWAQRFAPTVLPNHIVIAGGSLGGVCAAGVVRRIPKVISAAIVQSAALWWPDYGMQELHAWKEATIDPHVKVFHEVGSLEPFLLEENHTFATILHDKLPSHNIFTREYPGGHDYICWRKGIIDALHWITTSFPYTAFM